MHTKSGITKFVRDGRVYSFTPSNEFMERMAEKRGMSLPDVTTTISNLQESESLQECAEEKKCPVEINNTKFHQCQRINVDMQIANLNKPNVQGNCIMELGHLLWKILSI